MKTLEVIFFFFFIIFIFLSFSFFNSIREKENSNFSSEKVAISRGDEEDYLLRTVYVKNKSMVMLLAIVIILIIYFLKLLFF